MKALSVRAPWWWFILHGGKDIENRDWPTKFRGTIYLHVGKWWNEAEIRDDLLDIERIVGAVNMPVAHPDSWLKPFCGCIVGKVDIADCVRESDSPWFFGDFGFVLANPVALSKPIPFKGALGFFEIPDDVHVCEYHRLTGDEEKRCFTCQRLM